MSSVRFMACAVSLASLALTAGIQGAAAFPAGAASRAAEAGIARNIPVTRVQWWGDEYAYGFEEWKHVGWGDDGGYGDDYYGGYDPCCRPRRPCCAPPPPCCAPPPPPPPPAPCCQGGNYYEAPFQPIVPPPYIPLK
jgi:hypothetical protein